MGVCQRRYDSRYNINDNLGVRNSWLWMTPRVEDILSNYGNDKVTEQVSRMLELNRKLCPGQYAILDDNW